MAVSLMEFETPVLDSNGRGFHARACGRERGDKLWEGWIEFENSQTGEILRSARETTQPNLADLKYWATGLTAVYLEGALARVLNPPNRNRTPLAPPSFDGPAEYVPASESAPRAVLNPFSVYVKNPDALAQKLTALRGWHLRQIIRDYQLAEGNTLEGLTEPELAALIVRRVRQLHP
jgi:hypothetical protein